MNHDELRRLYEVEKLSTRQIAARYGVNKETARTWLSRAGIRMRSRVDAALLREREHDRGWTEERLRLLRKLWVEGVTGRDIKAALGIGYGPRAIYAKAAAIGLSPRQEPKKRPTPAVRNVAPVLHTTPRAVARYIDRTLISFLPNERLQAAFEAIMAEVRAERGTAASQAKWGF